VHTLRHLLLLLLLAAALQQALPQVLVHHFCDEWSEWSHDLGHQQQHVEQRTQRSYTVFTALATLQE
jgi:hypothetical protein